MEGEVKDPPSEYLIKLELNSKKIFGNSNWASKVDQMFVDALGTYRKYDFGNVQDLLRAIRNKVIRFPLSSP